MAPSLYWDSIAKAMNLGPSLPLWAMRREPPEPSPFKLA